MTSQACLLRSGLRKGTAGMRDSHPHA
jgi:hypothetical protein